MKRVKIVSMSLVLSFFLITVVGLSFSVLVWSFLLLLLLTLVYYLVEFSLLNRG